MEDLGIHLPPIRKLIVPSPRHILCDVDLSGADAQVVAWESEDAELKAAFRAGIDIHDYNGKAMWGEGYRSDVRRAGSHLTQRDELKRAVHGTNYYASARTLAITLGWKVAVVEDFQRKWFSKHPGIRSWHGRTSEVLQKTRTIKNRFGYRIVYFGRLEGTLSKALAWLPQSTIAEVCSRGALQLRKRVHFAKLRLQVHDSLLFELPVDMARPAVFTSIREALHNPVPYPDPLTIGWGIKISGKSWWDCKKVKWKDLCRDGGVKDVLEQET